MKNIQSTGLLALAGIALFAASAKSQSAVTFTPGDLLLGFHESGSPSGLDYEIDLGQASTYINATHAFTISGLGGTASDLATAFGANWQNSNTLWGVAGTTDVSGTLFGLPNNTLFVSRAETTPGTQSTPFTESPSGQQSTTRGVIQAITGETAPGSGGFNGSTSTANSSVAILQTDSTSSDANDWASANPPTGTAANSNGASFKKFSPTIEGSFSNGASNSVLDLYELQPHATNPLTDGEYLGAFSIDNSGDITFTPVSAVPEPSTWASLVLAALSVFLLARRRVSPVEA